MASVASKTGQNTLDVQQEYADSNGHVTVCENTKIWRVGAHGPWNEMLSMPGGTGLCVDAHYQSST